MKKSLILIGFFLLCALGCSSDDDTSTDSAGIDSANDAESTDSGGAETSMGTPGIPGCYDLSVHMCDCALSEAECADAGRIWTDRCNCGEDGAADEAGGSADHTHHGAHGGADHSEGASEAHGEVSEESIELET